MKGLCGLFLLLKIILCYQKSWDLFETKTFGTFWEWDWDFLKPFFWDRYQYSQTGKVLIPRSLEKRVSSRDLTLRSSCCGCKRCSKNRSCNDFVMEAKVVQVVVDEALKGDTGQAWNLRSWVSEKLFLIIFPSFDMWACRTAKEPQGRICWLFHTTLM